MSSSSSAEEPAMITLTLVSASTGQSEGIPLPVTATLQEVMDLCRALFGFDSDTPLVLFKEGKPLAAGAATTTTTLQTAGVGNGDVLAVQHQQQQQPSSSSAGGLDFSSLLAGVAAPAQPPEPRYWNGMDLNEAVHYNPHPHAFSKEHLFKELNYHNPRMAEKLKGQPHHRAVQIWQEETVKGSIQAAVRTTTRFHEEQEMTKRLAENANDPQAKEYFDAKRRKEVVQQQYEQMMQEYPESMGRVLMLYIEASINGHAIQAFCDSGAQMTIMSRNMAIQCGLEDSIDTRFSGTAVGVGTGKIFGKIHTAQLQIGAYFFPCSVTVMDHLPVDPKTGVSGGTEMGFLLGLDMMKRHMCVMDMGKGVLKFRLSHDSTTGESEYLETPFLHEKDLDEDKGGTKGFDAVAANQKLLELQRKAEEEQEKQQQNGDKDNDGTGDAPAPMAS